MLFGRVAANFARKTFAKLQVRETNSIQLRKGTRLMFAAATKMMMTAPTPLTIIGANSASADSVTIPPHNVNDLIVLFAFNESSVSGAVPIAPAASGTVPAYATIDLQNAGNQCSGLTAYFIATTGSETSGTWSHTTDMIAVVLRGAYATAPIGGHGVNNGTDLSNAIAGSITMVNTDGTSQLLYFFGHRNIGAVTWSAAPSGYVQQVFSANSCLDTASVTTSDGGLTQAITASGQSGYVGATVEIRSH